ncbi:hypothetical protein H0H87_004405 [Tephrocybe sp. NHM501043]|nr:hypothetical protein H0H87_004405 [Tephrocybe sp. NHM501043]
MVVARKTPVAPVPSSSRSSSSQQVPKPAKSKTAPPPAASSNGKVSPPPKKPKSPVTKKRKHTSSSYPKLFLVLLSAFTAYTVSLCRADFPRTSPICHSLDLYRQHVLDPYVVPPIRSLVHHAEPYIEPIKPYASSAADFTRTHVAPRASALLDLTLEQYHAHIAPRLHWFFVEQYLNGILKPLYYKGLHPYIEPHFRPYQVYYRKVIVPTAQKLAVNAHATYIRFRPYAVYYLSEVQRHTINAYGIARPRVIATYQLARPHVIVVLKKIKINALDLSSKVGDARREFVDPHVLRIWEKVVEADATPSFTASWSSETATPASTQALKEEPTLSSSSIVAEPVVQTPEPVVTPDPVAEPEPTPEAEPEVIAPSSQEETASPTSQEEAIPSPSSSPEPSPSSSSGADIPAPSAQVHVASVPATEHEAASAASLFAASLHASEWSAPEAEPEQTASAEEVDDFLKDIGISEDGEIIAEPVAEEKVEEVQTEAAPPAYGDPEPSPEEKLAITAKKRADITSRHERWQADLDALARAQLQGIRASLSESRAAAVAELAEWGQTKKGVVHEVEGEANKLLKGLDGYLRGVEEKIKKANGKQTREQREKDKETWAKVVEKVELRFAEKVRDVQKEVHEWFMSVRERELKEIESASETVKTFADRAQADLGLDYAWLDDVTYYDWQKYHDLMRTSENFTSQGQKIQAQVDPVGTNELIDALNDLERDVNELVEGFEVVIAGDRRRAETEVFVDVVEPETPTEEKAGEPEVSILPIEPVKEKVVPEDIFVGRSKEEVEAKLADVPVEDVRAGREEL